MWLEKCRYANWPCALIQLFTATALIQLKSFPLLWRVSIRLMTWPLGPFENSFGELVCLDKFEEDVHCGISSKSDMIGFALRFQGFSSHLYLSSVFF